MKKIINGKVYDTETAKRIGAWDNGHYTNDFEYCSEDIYRKKTGEFFLHGEGHALSKYASRSGNSSGWGEEIIPLTYQEAQEWSEKHLTGDEYVAIFGAPNEDAEKTQLNLYLQSSVISKLKREASKRGISVGSLVEECVTKLLED